MTFEDLIKEANSKGLYLNNLFQRVDYQWQANFRTMFDANKHVETSKLWPWGLGATAEKAIRMALNSEEAITEEAVLKAYHRPTGVIQNIDNPIEPSHDRARVKGKITIIRRKNA